MPCILTFSTDSDKERDKAEKMVKASLSQTAVTQPAELPNLVELDTVKPSRKCGTSSINPQTPHIPISVDSEGEEPPQKKCYYSPNIDTQLIVMGDKLTD